MSWQGGSSVRVVPGHSGGDWAAEIGTGGIWMKIEQANEAFPLPEKTEGGLEKGLANQWSRKRITKKAYTGCGPETIWEIPIQI